MILSLAAERGTRREAKRRWSETVWRSDSQQLSSGKLKNESRDTDSIWQNKDRDRRVERQKWRGQREEETTLGIVGLKPERGRGGWSNTQRKVIEFKLVVGESSLFPDSVSSIMLRPEHRQSSCFPVTHKTEPVIHKWTPPPHSKKPLLYSPRPLQGHTGICLCE